MNVSRYRTWLGPALILLAVIPTAIILEIALGGGRWAWLVHGYSVLALLVCAAYAALVVLPAERMRRQLAQGSAQTKVIWVTLSRLLDDFRNGDLVNINASRLHLPEALEEKMTAAVDAVSGLVKQIQISSVDVAGTANAVRDTASQLASGSSQQAASVVQISATMEELARTAAQIATNAAAQADLATQSEIAGRDGAQAIEKAVLGIESIRDQMGKIAGRAETLDSRSREIYRVLDLITDIAQETHILSLNAAIEASAAGEHGERFAVVAREVRRLAERSRESVESIRNLLHEFTGAIHAVVLSTEEGNKTTEDVVEQGRATAVAIEQLSAALGTTSQAAQEISLATSEQQTASQEVLVTVKEEAEVINQIAEGLEEFTGAASRLNQLALSIQLLAQSFRVDSSHSLKNLVFDAGESITAVFGNLEATEGILRAVFAKQPYLELAYLVDPEGRMVAFAVNHDLVGKGREKGVVDLGQSYADRPWFQAVARNRGSTVTPVYESLLTNSPCFTVVVPVAGDSVRQGGMLAVDVNVENWTRI